MFPALLFQFTATSDDIPDHEPILLPLDGAQGMDKLRLTMRDAMQIALRRAQAIDPIPTLAPARRKPKREHHGRVTR